MRASVFLSATVSDRSTLGTVMSTLLDLYLCYSHVYQIFLMLYFLENRNVSLALFSCTSYIWFWPGNSSTSDGEIALQLRTFPELIYDLAFLFSSRHGSMLKDYLGKDQGQKMVQGFFLKLVKLQKSLFRKMLWENGP